MKRKKTKTFDGIRLYSEEIGKGLTFICCNGVGVSTFFWNYLKEYYHNQVRIITWDYRGHGRSDHPPDNYRYQFMDTIQDLHTIVKTHKIEKAIFLGHSMGAQVILEYYLTHPDRVLGLIPILGTYGHAVRHLYNSRLSLPVFKGIHHLYRRFPETFDAIWRSMAHNPLNFSLAKLLVVNKQLCQKSDMDRYFTHLHSIDLGLFLDMVHAMESHTTFNRLSQVKVPTLIVAGKHDVFTPHERSIEMHEAIPDAELLSLNMGSHAAIVEQPELINLRIEKFVRDHFRDTYFDTAPVEKTGDTRAASNA